MDKAELKHFGKPDEVREFPKGCLELFNIAVRKWVEPSP